MHKELGRRPPEPDDQEAWHLYEGVSVFDSLDGARTVTRRYPRKGQLAAVLDIAEGECIRYDKTRGPGHYTLWGEASEMLAHVVSVERL